MSIYEKPVRLLMKDFVQEQNLIKGQVITREQVVSWFKLKYPKIRHGTISAHMLKMSVNAPSRIHYSVSSSGDDDLFFQIDSHNFRLYDPGNDPPPIKGPLPLENGRPDEEPEDEESEGPTQTGFAYESDLRNFLSRNLYVIEAGLTLFEEEGITGVEFPVGGRFIDILAIDRQKNYVVIELKVSRGYDRTIGQLLRYMAWVEKYQAQPTQQVRGVIIAREISEDLKLASEKIPFVDLFEYDLAVTLRKIKKGYI